MDIAKRAKKKKEREKKGWPFWLKLKPHLPFAFSSVSQKMVAKAMRVAMRKGMKKAAMKAMKRRAMKKSVVAKGKSAKSVVFRGTKVKTSGGLKKGDLVRNKRGKVVSKKASARSKSSKGGKAIMKWGAAFKQARKALGVKGFCPCGGKTAQGKALLAKTRALYKK